MAGMAPPQRSYPAWAFLRQDETTDGAFYATPRLVVHVDDAAIEAISAYYGEALPRDGVVLDVMSSWRSHLPGGYRAKRVVGLGMNAVELAENPRLDERVVYDLNVDSTLPFPDAAFDAAMVTVSVQYLTKPVEVFREMRRVLAPGGMFHVVFSNRCFPTKAIALWQSLDDGGHADLVASYFANSGGWELAEFLDRTPRIGGYADPVLVVRARKTGFFTNKEDEGDEETRIASVSGQFLISRKPD